MRILHLSVAAGLMLSAVSPLHPKRRKQTPSSKRRCLRSALALRRAHAAFTAIATTSGVVKASTVKKEAAAYAGVQTICAVPLPYDRRGCCGSRSQRARCRHRCPQRCSFWLKGTRMNIAAYNKAIAALIIAIIGIVNLKWPDLIGLDQDTVTALVTALTPILV